jgi:excisionase family DNA binding protein
MQGEMMAAAVVEREAPLEKEVSLEHEPVAASASDQGLLEEIEALLCRATEDGRIAQRPRLVGPDGEAIELPEPIFRLLRQIVPHLKKGHALSLVPLHKELSTQQAADLLNVSRPFLIGLLERGEIPYTKVGKHRRIRFGHLIAYKRARDAGRRETLRRLTQLGQEFGLDQFDD